MIFNLTFSRYVFLNTSQRQAVAIAVYPHIQPGEDIKRVFTKKKNLKGDKQAIVNILG